MMVVWDFSPNYVRANRADARGPISGLCVLPVSVEMACLVSIRGMLMEICMFGSRRGVRYGAGDGFDNYR